MNKHRATAESEKVKIGTILRRDIVEKLKLLSLRKGKNMSAIIEEAILRYDEADQLSLELRRKAFKELMSMHFNLSPDDWREIMEEDYYDQ